MDKCEYVSEILVSQHMEIIYGEHWSIVKNQ